MTYRELLNKYKTIAEEKDLEVEAIKLLILELSNYDGASFLAHFDDEIENDKLNILLSAIGKYVNDFIPVQHILGYAYFYGYKLNVSKDVLVPRCETEELVGYVLEYYDEIFKGKSVEVCDIGTGSGAISIALNKEEPKMNLTATDISKEALEIAKLNARNNDARIKFLEGDLLEPLINNNLKFDILVSNPPYIALGDEVDPLVVKNEPHLALFSENNGMECYERILKDASKVLNKTNIILFEHGYKQKELMINLVDKYFPNSECEVIKDLSGNDRITVIINK